MNSAPVTQQQTSTTSTSKVEKKEEIHHSQTNLIPKRLRSEHQELRHRWFSFDNRTLHRSNFISDDAVHLNVDGNIKFENALKLLVPKGFSKLHIIQRFVNKEPET